MTPLSATDLDAYLARIGHDGPCAPDLSTLRALHRLHPRAIAFENLDPLLGRPVGLDLPPIVDKLVRGRRGGWCFEQNFLFAGALSALGFSVSGLSARVIWGRPAGVVAPRTHMLLRIDLDGAAFVADVGFGGLTLTAPLRLVPDVVQETPHEPFRLAGAGGEFRVEALAGDAWRPLYRFDLQRQFEVDYQAASHFLSTHPSSPFLSTLLAARAPDDGRLSLLGNRLRRRHAGGRDEEIRLETGDALMAVLKDEFGIAVPEPERLVAAARRIGLFGDDAPSPAG